MGLVHDIQGDGFGGIPHNAITAKLKTRFVILSNELPNMGDSSGALAGRLVLLSTTDDELIHVEIDYRGGEKCEELADNQTANNGYTKWLAQFSSVTPAQG